MMKKILILSLIMTLLAGCYRKSSEDNKLRNDSLHLKSFDSISIKKALVPKDTLGFLSLKELLEYQYHEKLVIPEILKYSLSPEIRIIRNELYARKGYIFKDQFLKEYFSYKDWYKPKIYSVDSIIFSSDEQILLDTLMIYEKRNKDLTIDSLRDELRKILLGYSNSKNIPITLWKHIIGYYPRSTNLGVAPWDFLGNSYTLTYSDTTLGFYHCIISFYCGAEGPNCVTETIYILDKSLKLKNQTDIDFTFNEIKQIDKGIYSFSSYVDKGDENYAEQKGIYKILNTGEIEIKNNR